MTDASYWHGGIRGLKVGDKVLPPSATGTERTLLKYSQEEHPGVQNGERVYVTTDRNAGKAFAAVYPRGSLYRVEPEGSLEVDPDNPDGTSFECPSATILAVYDAYVVMDFAKAVRVLGGRR